MAITLNQAAVERAKYLINAGECTSFDADWNEEKPTRDEVIEYIDNHDIKEYGLWFLGKNDAFDRGVKEHYEYPCGDLREIQRCALVHTIEQAQERGDMAIVSAAEDLIRLIDEKSE
jgi:hypothetical protein